MTDDEKIVREVMEATHIVLDSGLIYEASDRVLVTLMNGNIVPTSALMPGDVLKSHVDDVLFLNTVIRLTGPPVQDIDEGWNGLLRRTEASIAKED
jgi:hypothetical protein